MSHGESYQKNQRHLVRMPKGEERDAQLQGGSQIATILCFSWI